MMCKAYSNRKKESERPLNDFYPTPNCMVLELIENGFLENKFLEIIHKMQKINNFKDVKDFNN